MARDTSVNGGSVTRVYAQQDANHDITSLTNSSGSVLERFIYDPYGKQTVLNPSSWSATTDSYSWVYGFQGGRLDPLTSLVNFRNRDLNPTTGTWMEQDPAGYVDGADLYEFVESDPLALIDPTGCAAESQPATKPTTLPSTQPSIPMTGTGNASQPGALDLATMNATFNIGKVTGDIIQHVHVVGDVKNCDGSANSGANKKKTDDYYEDFQVVDGLLMINNEQAIDPHTNKPTAPTDMLEERNPTYSSGNDSGSSGSLTIDFTYEFIPSDGKGPRIEGHASKTSGDLTSSLKPPNQWNPGSAQSRSVTITWNSCPCQKNFVEVQSTNPTFDVICYPNGRSHSKGNGD